MNQPKIEEGEINKIIPILQELVWAGPEIRAKIQKSGVDVIWSHFYSNIPSVEEIESSYEYTSDEPPYLDEDIFNKERLRATLENLIEFSKEFSPPTQGDEENCEAFFWENSQFSYSDAMAYYCFVRMLKPNNIIEIGSGFSTLVAVEALKRNGAGCIHCIEPYPRDFLKKAKGLALYQKKAQDVNPDFFNQILGDGDFLFIDSTHTVKTGSDCLHIYLRLLPRIRRNIYVHAHDVFLPFGLPKDWLLNRQIFWTEQYLLLAFMIDNPKTSLLYSSTLNSKWYSDLMKKMMGDKYPIGGGSVWFKYNNGAA